MVWVSWYHGKATFSISGYVKFAKVNAFVVKQGREVAPWIADFVPKHLVIPQNFHTENVASFWAYFSISITMMPSISEQHNLNWLLIIRVVLCVSCFLYAVDEYYWTWRHFILQIDCSHCLWSHITLLEPIALSDTNHHACRVFILSQNYRLLIYLWGKWKQGCADEFQSWTHWFISREGKVRRWHVSPRWTEASLSGVQFCFTFRLNALFPAAAWWLLQRGFWSAWWEGWLHFLLIHSPLASELFGRLEGKCW